MADDAIIPTAYVYGPPLLSQVAQAQFPIGFHGQTPVTLAGLPIQLNAAFANSQKGIPSTVLVAGNNVYSNQGSAEEAGARVPSPVNPGAGEWRPTTAQKRQRTGSASELVHQPSTPTIHTPTSKPIYDWNNPVPTAHTPTQSAGPLTPNIPNSVSAQPMTLLSSIQQPSIPISQVTPVRTGSTPATPTGNTPLTLHGDAIWPGMGRPIMMADTQGSQQSLDFSDGDSDDSSNTPQSKLETGEWPPNPNGTLNSSLPQTPTSTTEGSDPNTPGANDAEGVWSPDIEHAFQEALAIYPPCGRRKIILSDEGKMYGRNELIARYIKLRTGKSRSRKQVSSHIQVLAKKKAREIQGKIKDPIAKDKAMANLSTMSSAQIVSASSIHSRPNLFSAPGIAPNAMPMGQMFTSSPVNPITIKQEPTTGLMWHPGAHTTLVQQPHSLPTHFQNLTGGMIPITFHPSAIGQVAIPMTIGSELTKTTITSPILTNQTHSPVAVTNHTQEITQSASTQQATPELSLKLVDFCAFVESQANQPESPQKHVFARIADANFVDPDIETIDISHIWDKFPQKNGGLKDMYEKGPQHVFFLVKFWGSVSTPLIEEADCFYGVSSRFEGSENKTITCSTKVCSFGTQVVEKVETEYAKFENGRFVYRINRSPMCEYMLNFIQRLYHLPENYMMNNVLEQFTILQVVSDRDTQETLLCLAYLFEVNSDENGNKFSLYRLVKSN